MKIRGIYSIKQIDRTLREDELKKLARDQIANQLVDATIEELGNKLIREEPNEKYEYGRFYIDVDITVVES